MLKKYPRKFLKSAQIAKSFGGKITIVEYDEKVAKQAKLDFERAGRHGEDMGTFHLSCCYQKCMQLGIRQCENLLSRK